MYQSTYSYHTLQSKYQISNVLQSCSLNSCSQKMPLILNIYLHNHYRLEKIKGTSAASIWNFRIVYTFSNPFGSGDIKKRLFYLLPHLLNDWHTKTRWNGLKQKTKKRRVEKKELNTKMKIIPKNGRIIHLWQILNLFFSSSHSIFIKYFPLNSHVRNPFVRKYFPLKSFSLRKSQIVCRKF